MAVRKVLLHPHPVLKQVAAPVDLERQADLVKRVVGDLVDTLEEAGHSVGLAAPQVGELVRVVVVDCSNHPKAKRNNRRLVLLNPIIVESSGAVVGREGCMSIPDLTANVRRAERVSISALSLAGEQLLLDNTGFEARVLQHELDHLDGILFLDRVASLNRDVFQRKRYG